MSIELLYAMILLLSVLFVNEHFISKELRKVLIAELYMKEAALTIADEILNEIHVLDDEIVDLRQQLNTYEQPPHTRERPKIAEA